MYSPFYIDILLKMFMYNFLNSILSRLFTGLFNQLVVIIDLIARKNNSHNFFVSSSYMFILFRICPETRYAKFRIFFSPN